MIVCEDGYIIFDSLEEANEAYNISEDLVAGSIRGDNKFYTTWFEKFAAPKGMKRDILSLVLYFHLKLTVSLVRYYKTFSNPKT